MRRLAAFLLPLLACCAGPAVAATVLTLSPTALADGARVTLADVAHGAAPAPLAAVDLGAAPLPGYTLRLAKADIARILRSRALPYQLAADGPEVVQVERRSQAFDQARVADAAEQALRELARADGTRLDLRLAIALPELALPAGTPALRARAPAVQALRQRYPTVWIDVLVNGAFVRTVPVNFELHAWHPVLVAVRDLAPGAVPACADLQSEEADLTALPGTPVERCADVKGRLTRPLVRGQALARASLNAAAVGQGETVALQFADGAIALESRATALADGAPGQRIDVRPAGAIQAVRAEVVAPGIVRITEK